MNILLTGSTGFIGSHLISELLDEGHIIFGITRQAANNTTHKNLRWLHGDLRFPLETSNLPQNIDVIIHLAQSENYRDFPQSATELFYVNTLSTQHLLDYAKRIGVKTFIYASSGGVYGSSRTPFKEEAPLGSRNELGFYIGTKLCSEILANSYQDYMNIEILRFFFVYGPNQKETMLIPRLINSISNGLPIKLQGPDGIKINPIYVKDATAAIKSSFQLNTSQKINVAGLETINLKQICEIGAKILNKSPVFEMDAKSNPNHLIGDTGKMQQMLCIPKINLADGLLRIICKE